MPRRAPAVADLVLVDMAPKTMRLSQFLVFLLVAVFVLSTGCSKHSDPTLPHQKQDPALQTALDELKRLSSFTEAGLNYTEYSDRLLTAKGNIDVALQRTNDEPAKDKINQAVEYHIEARKEWKRTIDDKYHVGLGPQVGWAKARAATEIAAKYAFADEATRQEIDAREQANREEEIRQQQEEARLVEEARKKEAQAELERQAKEAEAEKIRKEAQRKKMAEDAERERIRRFAPEGTVFNLKPLSVTHQDGLTTIPPGTELKVTKKSSDGTLHVQTGDLTADVPPSAVTNDRDLAATVRSDDKSKQEALRQWNAQQAAIASERDREKYNQTTPTPSDDSTYSEPKPRYVSPLERGSY